MPAATWRQARPCRRHAWVRRGGRSRDARVLGALTAWAVCNLAGTVVLLRVIGDFSAVVRKRTRTADMHSTR